MNYRRFDFPLLVVFLGGAVAIACAQPGNPGPAAFTNLGSVGIGQTVSSPEVQLASGAVVWFRFQLTTAIQPRDNWLDLDTSGPTTLTNPWMAIYDARANRIGEDNNSGGSCGAPSNESAAAMSFGGGSAQRISGVDAQWGGGRMSTGSFGPTLEAGVYWVGIAASVAQFDDPNPTWTATSDSTESGTVRLKISTGAVAPVIWNEVSQGTDAGHTPDTSLPVVGESDGALTTILCNFLPTTRDMFEIRICDGASFQAVASATTGGGGILRSRLYLFDAEGRGVFAINNTSINTDTTLARPVGMPPLANGDYYLAISTRCSGAVINGTSYGQPTAYDAANQMIWDFTGHDNATIAPNGPGAANPMAYWGRLASCESTYYTRITLTGACYIPDGGGGPTTCPGDLDGDGVVAIQDLAILLASFGTICP